MFRDMFGCDVIVHSHAFYPQTCARCLVELAVQLHCKPKGGDRDSCAILRVGIQERKTAS